MNWAAMARHGLILWENGATGLGIILKYIPGPRYKTKKIDELDQIYKYDLDISDRIEKLLLIEDFSEFEIISSISQISIILKNRNNYIKDFK